MAKKFFYNRVYNTKRTAINITIIVVCVIGIILCFVLTSNFQNNNPGELGHLTVKTEVTVGINEKIDNSIFFSKIENFDINDAKITYPDNFDISKPGTYRVSILINNDNYTSNLIVVDTEKPVLSVKNITIEEGRSYSAKDFVISCSDNSKADCKIAFYSEGLDEEGKKVDYSSYKTAGIYAIKISASDESGNQIVKEAKLTINNKNTTTTPTPSECKYGNNLYDKTDTILAVDITTNGCAVNVDLYEDPTIISPAVKVLDSETPRIQKDVEALNIGGKFSIIRNVLSVRNITGNGFVGYEIVITINVTKSKEETLVVKYKLDSNGKRVFISNPYNLPS